VSAPILNGGPSLGNALQSILTAEDIQPGDPVSYQTAKTIYLLHPFGQKLADVPISMAQYKPREITVPKAPGDGLMMVEAFKREWEELKCDRVIFNAARLARIYGVSTLGLLVKDDDTATPLDFQKLADAQISLSVWDPLNTAGSLVLNQDPNAMDFQKVAGGVSVGGKGYQSSRVCVLQNEDPIYIAFESSGFGFTGRSIYQRGLYPLKSFIATMITDGMIALKAGVLVSKMNTPSSAVDGPMSWLLAARRDMVKEAQTGNVLSIGTDENVESLDLHNLEGSYLAARKNIIENIASACSTPAKILLAETFAEGFGEGTEDAKAVAQFIDGLRGWMAPLYAFMEEIVMYRAWNKTFYERVVNEYPEEYDGVSYAAAFQEWRNSFQAKWPNLLEETDSEKSAAEKVTLEALVSTAEVLLPIIPQDQKAKVIEWIMENVNGKKHLFTSPLELDLDAVAAYEPTAQESIPSPPLHDLADSAKPQRRVHEKRTPYDAVDREVRKSAFRARM